MGVFYALDDILGTKPSTQPPVVIDTSDTIPEVDNSPVSPASISETTLETAGSSKSLPVVTGETSHGKKRKRSKPDDIDGVVQQLLCAVEKSDKDCMNSKRKE